MGQIQKKRETEEKGQNQNNDVKSAFESIRDTKLKRTRTVKLIYRQACGCGPNNGDIEITREVDIDSPLQDGDSIPYVEKGDSYTINGVLKTITQN